MQPREGRENSAPLSLLSRLEIFIIRVKSGALQVGDEVRDIVCITRFGCLELSMVVLEYNKILTMFGLVQRLWTGFFIMTHPDMSWIELQQ